MNLILDIAWTHVRARVRQTGFAVAGVATGVGFSIMMASLMQGSQDDFIRQLVNAMPHVTVYDERRSLGISLTQEAAPHISTPYFFSLSMPTVYELNSMMSSVSIMMLNASSSPAIIAM